MDHFVRGLFWFGAYFAAVLAPLAAASFATPLAPREFAVEFAVALGFVAFGVLAVEFALVSRVHRVSRAFGTDLLMLFHRRMGIAALAFAAAHAAIVAAREGLELWSSPAARSATIACAALTVLVLSSLARRRLNLRYEIWQATHGALALLTAGAALAHILLAARWSSAELVRVVVIAEIALFALLLARYRVLRPLAAWRAPWIVEAVRDEGADTRTLVLRPDAHRGLEFEAGQFVWLSTGRTPIALEQHPVTISSSAELGATREVELTIKALGDWSGSVVPKLAVGSRVWLDGPFGAFTLERAASQALVFIAGGVGVTPMRSMLETMRARGDRRPALLVYATHDATREIFARELARLERELSLEVVRVHEVPSDGSTLEHGFVDAALLRRHLRPGFARFDAFVCGPVPMMDAVERALAELGVPSERVHTERFDMV